jgi:hypothetical protein
MQTPTPSNGAEQVTAAAEAAQGSSTAADTTVSPEQTGSFDPIEVLESIRKPEVNDEQRTRDRERHAQEFSLAFTVQSKKIEKLIQDEGMDIEDAIAYVNPPKNVADKIRKVAEGKIADTPLDDDGNDIKGKIDSEFAKRREEDTAKAAFSNVVESAKLDNSQTEELAREVDKLAKLGHPLTEAVKYASAALGYSFKQALRDAEKRGVMRGLKAIPPEGEPVPPPTLREKTKYGVDTLPGWLKPAKKA